MATAKLVLTPDNKIYVTQAEKTSVYGVRAPSITAARALAAEIDRTPGIWPTLHPTLLWSVIA